MKLVYTHPNGTVVAQARNALERAGIGCHMRNEFAAGAIGELAPNESWPELWVDADANLERAQQALATAHAEITEADWRCARCASDNPPTFEFCWCCGQAAVIRS